MATKQDDYKSIMADLKNNIYKPIYLLMGEESYYIDAISEYIKNNSLKESEKDFNLFQLFGSDVKMTDIVATARRYPMMAERTVVIVKEAQNITDFDNIVNYVKNPPKQSVLVLCYKYKSVDKRKKYISDISQIGVLFESKKLYESSVPAFISDFLREKDIDIDPKASQMLTNFLGTDLTKIMNELNKLCEVIGSGKKITPEIIEKYVGINKDYNPFELINALINKDIFKANQIVFYFDKNPKNASIQQILSVLFNFFSNLMIYFYMPNKSDNGLIAKELGVSPYFVKDYVTASKNISAVKTMNIISILRECDARSKGIDQNKISDGDLLKELVHFILY